MDSPPPRNRLASETSLYLQQHAGNPVDWYPWGQEALERAAILDRPILLSIGYSACHWCHVMERECFENSELAALMNRLFVCIKVDREERPDLDQLYMKALQGMTGGGGWPMTMFLTPDGRPFYGGTYFPAEDRGNLPGLGRVLLGVAQTWTEKRQQVLESAGRMVEYLGDPGRAAERVPVDVAALQTAVTRLMSAMDPEHGGFGRAPKFPGSMALALMMEAGAGVEGADELVLLTLRRMANGGIRDHLGGGFHRYSVDREWLVPHFEKMLYDQASMAVLYLEAAKCFRDGEFGSVAAGVMEYVLAEMESPDGGFASAQDADSEGHEGRFFTWSRAEVIDVLGQEQGALFCLAYDVTDAGNFDGTTVLRRAKTSDKLARETKRPVSAVEQELARCRRLLLDRRSRRVAPATDRKVLADWNGLMISAMASAGAFLGREDFVRAAERAAGFFQAELRREGCLHHVYAGGVATGKGPVFLDDYAFLGRSFLDLFALLPREAHLATARFCAERLLSEFHDQSGGFYFTGSSNERLVARTTELHDGAVPAGNSVAAELLLRLWALTGEDRYRTAGEAVVLRFATDALENPHAGAHLLAVAARHHAGMVTVVVRGEQAACDELSRAARRLYRPGAVVVNLGDATADWWPAALRDKAATGVGARAYVCEGTTCSLPVNDAAGLVGLLDRGRGCVQGDRE